MVREWQSRANLCAQHILFADPSNTVLRVKRGEEPIGTHKMREISNGFNARRKLITSRGPC